MILVISILQNSFTRYACGIGITNTEKTVLPKLHRVYGIAYLLQEYANRIYYPVEFTFFQVEL